MCGRFTLSTPADVVAAMFDLDEIPGLEPRFNIAPSQEVAVVREEEAGRAVRMLRWGFHPAWSREAPGSEARMINARSETVAEKRAFRDAFARRRCLLPADGFFEWKRSGRARQPHLIRVEGGELFAFAGLWERWRGSGDSIVESCTILTTTPNELVAGIHDRMPVILPRRQHGPWLDPASDPGALHALLRPYPASAMSAFPVSRLVNDPRRDEPGCIEPVDPAPPAQGDLFG